MRTLRWSVVAALVALFCLPVSVSQASESADPSAKPTPTAAASSTDSESSDTESGSDSESGGSDVSDSDADNSVKTIDPDATREALESQYENPADVAMPPKLLLPKKPGQDLKQLPTFQSFDVVQLRHNFGGGAPDRHLEPGLTAMQNKGAELNAIPIDISTARISYKTPAQEFFDGATIGLAGLGSSAVALGSIVFFRARRKDPAEIH